eukprot:SAG31_NODE_508_length_14732_cov_75.624547_8_plen_92_part_00
MKIEQLGLQCYTIRDYCKTEQDFAESMAKAAAIGYKSVQISAVGPIDPATIKIICDKNGAVGSFRVCGHLAFVIKQEARAASFRTKNRYYA